MKKAEENKRWIGSMKEAFIDSINAAIVEKIPSGKIPADKITLIIKLPNGIYGKLDEKANLYEGKKIMSGEDILKLIYKFSR
jgi:hypothetical protein